MVKEYIKFFVSPNQLARDRDRERERERTVENNSKVIHNVTTTFWMRLIFLNRSPPPPPQVSVKLTTKFL